MLSILQSRFGRFQAGVHLLNKKVVINLATAKLDPILATGGKPPEPQPAMTVAQVLGLKTQQRFDITALVEKVSEASRKAVLVAKRVTSSW